MDGIIYVDASCVSLMNFEMYWFAGAAERLENTLSAYHQ